MAALELALITCEHGGNRVPRRYAALFQDHQALLRSHRGFDVGALQVARYLSRALEVPLLASTITRLLVDLNRSLDHPALLSEISRPLDATAQQQLLDEHYHPHRATVLETLRPQLRKGPTQLHIAAHSFAPVWKGKQRTCDVGFLYDPQRPLEASFVRDWRDALCRRLPLLRVRLNQPYRGWTDGLTTTLRSQFNAVRYLGIELEINQRLVRFGKPSWKALQRELLASLRQALGQQDERPVSRRDRRGAG